MKKILYLLSISFLILQSCSSSSDNSNQDNSSLYKRWYVVSTTINGSTTYPTVCSNNGHRDYVDFISPNIANFYFVASSTDNICSDDYGGFQSTFTKNGNIIQFYINGNLDFTLTILQLTATSLKLGSTDSSGGTRYTIYSSL